MFDERIGAALEIGDVDDVQVGMIPRETPGRKNAAAGIPEHIGMQIVDSRLVKRQKVERQNIDAVEIAQLVGNIAIAAPVIDVVRAADKKDGGLTRLFKNGTSLAARREKLI